MKLFTVGPVEMYDETLNIGSKQIPYFRTEEFSNTMLKIKNNFLSLVDAPLDSSFAVLTASGTGAMECAVLNCLNKNDKVLVINGGSFGKRFSELCEALEIPHDDLVLPFGKTLTLSQLESYEGKQYTALLVNMHETSIGQLYDINMLGDFCERNGMYLIVDAVSSFLVDELSMNKMKIDLMLTASQKALALSPGLSFIVSSPRMTAKINENKVSSIYFDLKSYFKNMERGQTPFTPAVGIVYELEERLQSIVDKGIVAILEEKSELANYFRKKCADLPIEIPNYPLSNGLTPIVFPNNNAYELFLLAKEKYGLMLTPNGGDLANKVLRIGHMGNMSKSDYDKVIEFFKEVLQ